MSGSPLLVVVGPTASGKTELAVRLCEQFDGEIISADSVQVYRHFDCGTGKPSPDERRRAAHHLVDILEPLEAIDAAGWAARAEGVLESIRAKGKLPIVCGGSFLWVRALIFGLAEAPAASPAIRERHRAIAESESRVALHAQLMKSDPVAAQRLNPNDFVRVSRALEVLELTGIPISQWQSEHGFRTQKHSYQLVGMGREREVLDNRIVARADKMLASGWLDEVRRLIAEGYGSARAMGSVGYRQVRDALASGELDMKSLRESIVRATRIFVRRQRTWLRDAPVRWIKPDAIDDLVRELTVTDTDREG